MGILHLTETEKRKHRRLSKPEKMAHLEKVARNRKLIALAHEKGDWIGFICLHEPQEKLNAFQEVQGELSDADYWSWLGEVWRELPDVRHPFAAVLFTSNRAKQSELMTTAEYNFYRKGLPDRIRVYSKRGISWRLSKGAPRGRQTIQKKDVLALFDRGHYYEVIVVPSSRL